MKIIVESEELKNEIIKQSKYVYDFIIDTDSTRKLNNKKNVLDGNMVCILMHLYMAPHIIQIDPLVK
jgi:hypothetical protein